jgi:hypothetical protein
VAITLSGRVRHANGHVQFLLFVRLVSRHPLNSTDKTWFFSARFEGVKRVVHVVEMARIVLIA